MTLSAVFLSKFSVFTVHRPARREALPDSAITRRHLGVMELTVPATVLRNGDVARWARGCGVAVEVGDSAELAVASATGIHPSRMTIHAGGLTSGELVSCGLEIGRVVVDTVEHIGVLGATCGGQRVLVTHSGLAAAVLACSLDLVGLYADVGPDGYPAAVGDALAAMARIRRDHGVVLTRVALGGSGLTFGAGPGELAEVASAIDETLDDACATLRFPRPVVTVSAEPYGSCTAA